MNLPMDMIAELAVGLIAGFLVITLGTLMGRYLLRQKETRTEQETSDYDVPALPDRETVPEPGPLPPGSRVPFHRNELFTGRLDSLTELAGTLLRQPDEEGVTLITQAVKGMGGIGKTQLAIEFAYRYGRFFEGVHWVDASRPEALDAEIDACGAAMCLPDWPDERPDQVARTLEEWRQGSRRLVILDGLEDARAAREWLGLLSGGPIRVLITARRSDWPSDLGLEPLCLDVFTPQESRSFLRRYLPKERAIDANLDQLADRLGHLPLALELAGRYLSRLSRLGVEAYLERLDVIWNHPSMNDWREDLGSPTGHGLDLAATFALSWDQVTDENARRLLMLAGYCAPHQPIPLKVFEEAAKLDIEACDSALALLGGLGLLEMEDLDAGPTIHPLLAEYGRAAVLVTRDEGREILSALVEALTTLSGEAAETGLPVRLAPLRPHMETAVTAASEARLEQSGALWNELGHYYRVIADYDAAQTAYEQAVEIDGRVHGHEHSSVAVDLRNLGQLFGDLKRLARAREAFERALAIDEAVHGPEHPRVAIDINKLASVLLEQGDLTGAREAFERALAIDEAEYGPDHPEVATDVNNLGTVLLALGDLAGAREAHERALAIDEAEYGPDHPELATGINNLGAVLEEQGDLTGAREAYERALTIWRDTFGDEHPHVAIGHSNLGLVLQEQGDLIAAREAFERALAIDEAVYGPEHPRVATDVNNLGTVLLALGDLTRAREACERALAIDEAVYGPDHPEVATDVNNLGLVLQEQGDLTGAREAYERALAIGEAVYGPEHLEVARAIHNLGMVLKEQGDLAGAREALERALAIVEAIYGPEYSKVAICLSSLGSILREQGDLAGAREAGERALAINEAIYGGDHPKVATNLSNLGLVLQEQGDLTGAREAYERALAIRERFFSPDHPSIETTRKCLEDLERAADAARE